MATSKQSIQCELWLLRYKRGDQSVLEEMIYHFEKPLFYFIRKLVEKEEDAWDTLQEVWLKVINQLPELHEPAALPTWLYRIARNTAISHFRKEYRFQELDEKEHLENKHMEDITFNTQNIDVLDLHNALSKLSLPHLEVITLHFLEGFTVSEISDITEISAGTVKSRLYYAKRMLHDVLQDTPGGEGDNHA